jgi:hypothetical protein
MLNDVDLIPSSLYICNMSAKILDLISRKFRAWIIGFLGTSILTPREFDR